MSLGELSLCHASTVYESLCLCTCGLCFLCACIAVYVGLEICKSDISICVVKSECPCEPRFKHRTAHICMSYNMYLCMPMYVSCLVQLALPMGFHT